MILKTIAVTSVFMAYIRSFLHLPLYHTFSETFSFHCNYTRIFIALSIFASNMYMVMNYRGIFHMLQIVPMWFAVLKIDYERIIPTNLHRFGVTFCNVMGMIASYNTFVLYLIVLCNIIFLCVGFNPDSTAKKICLTTEMILLIILIYLL